MDRPGLYSTPGHPAVITSPITRLPPGRSRPPIGRPDTLGVSAVPPLLIWLVLGLLTYCLVTAVVAVLAARAHFEVQRHDLIVRSKQMRRDYLHSYEEKIAGVVDDGAVIDDESTHAG